MNNLDLHVKKRGYDDSKGEWAGLFDITVTPLVRLTYRVSLLTNKVLHNRQILHKKASFMTDNKTIDTDIQDHA